MQAHVYDYEASRTTYTHIHTYVQHVHVHMHAHTCRHVHQPRTKPIVSNQLQVCTWFMENCALRYCPRATVQDFTKSLLCTLDFTLGAQIFNKHVTYTFSQANISYTFHIVNLTWVRFQGKKLVFQP